MNREQSIQGVMTIKRESKELYPRKRKHFHIVDNWQVRDCLSVSISYLKLLCPLMSKRITEHLNRKNVSIYTLLNIQKCYIVYIPNHLADFLYRYTRAELNFFVSNSDRTYQKKEREGKLTEEGSFLLIAFCFFFAILSWDASATTFPVWKACKFGLTRGEVLTAMILLRQLPFINPVAQKMKKKVRQ